MKVYISCHHPGPANDLAAILSATGHTIVSEWHTETTPRPAIADASAWQVKADRNIDLIRDADALVLIASPDHVAGTARVPDGKFVEAGAAIMAAKIVVVVGGIENGMLHAARVRPVADFAGVVEALARGAG